MIGSRWSLGRVSCALVSSLLTGACMPSANPAQAVQGENREPAGSGPARADPDPKFAQDLILARHQGGLSGGRLTGIRGELVLRGSCLLLTTPRGEYSLIWPRESSARKQSSGTWIVDLNSARGLTSLGTGAEVGFTGFGGGRSTIAGVKMLSALSDDCPKKAWVIQGLD